MSGTLKQCQSVFTISLTPQPVKPVRMRIYSNQSCLKAELFASVLKFQEQLHICAFVKFIWLVGWN